MRGRLLVGTLVLVFLVSLVPTVRADAPPHVTITHPANGSTVSGTVAIAGNAWDDVHVVLVKVHIDTGEWWNATDTSGNDTWWTWTTSWDSTTVANGWHHIGALAKDSAGQLADTSIEVYVQNGMENHAPWVEINTPPNHSTVSGITTVSGTSGDPDANDSVELVQVRIDDGDWRNATPRGDNGSWNHWSYDWNTTTVDDGWHAFSARAFDGQAYSGVAVNEYFVDNVPNQNETPVVHIVHPEAGMTVWGIVLVHGTASDDVGVTLVQVAIDDRAWADATDTSLDDSWSTWAYQWDTTTFDNGEHHVCARSFDGDLYSEVTCVGVNVANENHRPKVTIVDPKNGETVRGLILIHGLAADDVGVKLVEVRFNDGDWHHATDTSPDAAWTTWAYEWDTTKRDDGCLHISARAWDGSLFSEVYTIGVCVDNVDSRPWVKIVRPESGETVHGLYLIWGYAGDDHGVKLVQVRIDDSEWHMATNTGREHPWSTWAYEWATNNYHNGWHVVCARSFDGERYSEVQCVHVMVMNDIIRREPAPITDIGGASPFVAFGALAGIGVAILMWLRAHGYVRK
ncbi:MAG: hypothetical protein E6K18_08615 [Methanobacteriota archaeon]|nr:MAG: hypothetical protein E6K18_08615 [Euryarchaeota archaeon]